MPCAVSHKQCAQPKPQGADSDTTVLALSILSFNNVQSPPPHHEAQQGFPSRVGDERARRGVASICPGLRLSQRKYLKQISSSSEELKVDLSIP